ncbi:MAG: tetratricopeptide repeat protein, partial [Planctomycetota bacterium]
LLLGFVAVYGVSIVLFFVNARFRVPLSPVLAVGAGYALSQLALSLRSRDFRGLAAVGGPALALIALSNVIPAAVNQSDAAGFADLGRAELARGEADAALMWLTKATRLEPRSVQIRMALSSAILEATGDGERALRALREVEPDATAKDRAELEVRIFALRLRMGEAQTVLAEVALARRARPTDGSLRFVYAMAQSACGQALGAIETLGELLEAEPTNIAAALFRGQLQEALGRTEEARVTYEGAASRGQLSTPSEAAAIAAGLARCAPE